MTQNNHTLPRTVSVLLAFTVGLSLLTGCTKTIKVEVPPRVNLTEWPVIGLIQFSAPDAHAELAPRATRSFMVKLQSAQAGVRFLELGDQQQVLQAMHAKELNAETVKAIGAKYGVQAVVSGELDVTSAEPNFKLSPDLSSASARAVVRGSLSAKLRETSAGATVWSNGAHGKWSVAGFTVRPTGFENIGYTDSDDQYDRMLRELTTRLSADFRPRYEEREVE